MACVEGIEQRSGLDSADFTQDDPVWSPAKSGLQQVVERDIGLERISLAFDREYVRLLDVQFGGVLDDDDAILFRNEVSQYPQQRGLAGSGSPTDKQRPSVPNLLRQKIRNRARQRVASDKVIDGVMPAGELPDGQGR